MRTELTLNVRAFPVKIHDHRTGTERDELIVLDKAQLQTARLVGVSSKELIHRICDRHDYTVLYIGKPEKLEVVLNLEELYRSRSMTGKREAVQSC